MARVIVGVVGVLLSSLCATTFADEPAGPRIPGFERFFAQADSDPVRGGLLLLGELNCIRCHAADSAVGITAKAGPVLERLGDRVRPEFVRALLTNPHHADPGTTMPRMLTDGTDDERTERVEALVHFLAATGNLAESSPIASAVNRGQRLFHSIGCVACHDPLEDAARPLATSVPLGDLTTKYALAGLAQFLQKPLDVRPAGRMPHLNLKSEEARDLACFLLRELQAPATMTFKYYEGNWEKLPDFEQLAVKESGGASSFDVNLGQPDHFAVRFEGQFRVAAEGDYTFHLESDDGSRMTIGGREVVLNDGIHPKASKSGSARLAAGAHAFVLDYFEGGGEQELIVDVEGPGMARQSLEFLILAPPTQNAPPRFTANVELVKAGRAVFQKANCVACHEMKSAGERVAPDQVGRPLAEVNVANGCIAESPPAGLPAFSLTTRQREALARAIQAVQSGQRPLAKADERIAHAMTTFNCYACHERRLVGGIEPARNAYFQSNQPEMGDEGRLPPHLTGVGAKLREDWMKQVFEQGAKDRPYMFTRMPRFGVANVGSLAAALSDVDQVASLAVPETAPPESPDRKLKSIGRRLVGDRGMSCIKCHTWGDTKATGIQAMSLTTMTRRLTEDWFNSYLLNPQVYRAGTRMPAAWPGGQSPFADILDGDASRQIHSVWSFLTDGDDAAVPTGLGGRPIELVPEAEPILYRNFIDGVGTRAIAVGYPERVHLAFDANECRPALVWQGAFLDAAKHWEGRGAGFQKPLGDNVLSLPLGVPFAELTSIDQLWPKQPARELGYQFRGYRLDAHRRPSFSFQVGELRVEESFEPIADASGGRFRRTIRLSGEAPAHCHLRLAVGKQITKTDDHSFLIDGDWRLQLTGTDQPSFVRESGGRRELLVPVVIPGDKSLTINEEIAW